LAGPLDVEGFDAFLEVLALAPIAGAPSNSLRLPEPLDVAMRAARDGWRPRRHRS